MKKLGVIALMAALAATWCLVTQDMAVARPQYKKEHDKKYEGKAIEDKLDEAKCNVCHYGKSKKNRNDYGMALSKAGLTKEKYMELKSDKEAFSKHVQEAMEKVRSMKKPDTDTTYGELIDAGKLPGTNPEE